MKYRLIVFDWDGTLMDSEARIVDSMQTAVSDLELDCPTADQVRDIIGLGLLEAVQILLPQHAPDIRAKVVDRYRAHFLGSDGVPSRLFAGADDVIRELAGQGYLLAVATGKSRRGLDQAMTETGVNAYFHATRCADETFSKPHPQMLEQIMDSLGVCKTETLMVGDTEYDMRLAENARTDALAVEYGVHSRERLMQCGPLACLSNVREIPVWLSRSANATSRVA